MELDMISHRTGVSVVAVPSFDRFYEGCHVKMFRALVLVLGDRNLAAEAMDESFARAFERWESVGGYRNPEGWVYRVALNWSRSQLRKRHREVVGLVGDSVYEPRVGDPEVLEAVEALRFKYRAVIVCRFFLDWSIDQTAEALRIPAGTVKTRQHRAVSRLRKSLKEA